MENGGERRSCAPIGLADPSVFETASAPRRIHSPMVSAAGFAPASIRLEGEGLSCSATRRQSAGARRWRSPSKARVSRAGARYRAARRTNLDLAAGLPPATSRSKRGMICFSPREENGPPARTCTWTSAFARPCDGFFTTGGNWSPPPESHRPRPAYKAGTSLSTPDGHWSAGQDSHLHGLAPTSF